MIRKTIKMNKIRIFGIVILLIGIVLFYAFDNSGVDFLFGLLAGSGLILTITGKVRSKFV